MGLSSELKSSPDGFATYYNERKKRLTSLSSGKVSFSLAHFVTETGGELKICVKDSGSGFDFLPGPKGGRPNLSGRGLKLIDQLSESLTIYPPGNEIEVVYSWRHDDG